MNEDEALALVEQLSDRGSLTKAEKEVFKGCWSDENSYLEIARKYKYTENYVKDIGYRLWKMLSEISGEKVTKQNFKGVLRRMAAGNPVAPKVKTKPSVNPRQDWGEVIDVSRFYGRTAEIETLTQWIVGDRCRVVALLGMGGMGKTSLSIKLAEEVQKEFDFVIWRSLRYAPSFEDKITECIKILSNQEITTLSISHNDQITTLIEYLRKFRCLLVLDNFETLLQNGKQSGSYCQGYEPYGELLARVGETNHQSCILITSQEKPTEVATLEGDELPVRTLALSGLEISAGQTIISLKGLSGSEAETQKLVECYSGNPLALKIAATVIRDLHENKIANFLAEGAIVSKGIRNLLQQQFDRLSGLEQQVMFWLAINRSLISLGELQLAFIPSISKSQLSDVLGSLRWRSLIESNNKGFTQQPVVMEFITDLFVSLICQEIITESPQYLLTHALSQAQSQDYIRDSQIYSVIQPILNQLQGELGSPNAIEQQLQKLIIKMQGEAIASPNNYGGANLIHLFAHLRTDLTRYDFAHLTMRNCDLRSLNLHHVNFSEVTFQDCLFASTFGIIASVAFSPDGNRLVISDSNGDIYLSDQHGKQILICEEHIGLVWKVAFNPAQPVIASCGHDRIVRLWDSNTGKLLHRLEGHQSDLTAIAFSPDGQSLASAGYDRTIRLWDVTTGNYLQTLEGHQSSIWAVDFHPQGKILVSGGEDSTIKLWELQTGRCMQTLTGHQHWIKAISFSPDGKMLASGSFDQTVKLWNLHTGFWDCAMTLQGHTGTVTSIAFSPEGDRLASSSFDHTIKIWEIETGECLDTLQKHTNRIWTVDFHPNGTSIASGGDDHAVKIWDLQTGKCMRTIQGNSNAVYAIAYNSPQNILASGHEDQTIKLWNLNPNQDSELHPFCILNGHSNRIFFLAFSPDNQILASASADRTIKLWNHQTGQVLKTFYGHTSWVWAVAFSLDGKYLISGSHDHTIKIWDIESGECLKTLSEHPSGVKAIAFAPDGKTFFSGGYEKQVKHWDLKTGNCLRTWDADANGIFAVAVSPDNQYLATGGDDAAIRLWDIQTGRCWQTLFGHENQILDLLFTPSGDRLISSSGDRTIKIWNVATGKLLTTLENHLNWVSSLSLGIDTQTLFSASWDETINCWDLTTGSCKQTLRTLRRYEGMIIKGVEGLTEAQKMTFQALGAIA